MSRCLILFYSRVFVQAWWCVYMQFFAYIVLKKTQTSAWTFTNEILTQSDGLSSHMEPCHRNLCDL